MSAVFGNVGASAGQVNDFHANSDVDKSTLSQHHTLGTLPNQAAAGDHSHDGRNSRRVKGKNLDTDDVTYPVEGGALITMPTFSGTPLINGTYILLGSLCHFEIKVDFDNITSFGSGQYYLTLPFVSAHAYQFGDGCLHDISANRDYPIMAHVFAGSNQLLLKSIDAQGNTAYNVPFQQGTPVTLDTTDNFHIAGTYVIQN
jgi:hypothetical protein